MRWKLLIAASTLATLLGAGTSLGIAHGLLGGAGSLRAPDAAALAVFVVPVAAITFASIFVYRHTARLRPLQAAMTAMLSLLLTLAAIIVGSLLLTTGAPRQPAPVPATRPVE